MSAAFKEPKWYQFHWHTCHINCESSASCLVRTAAEAVHPHGSDEAGIASQFISFLKGRGRDLNIVTYRGNRFRIAF